MTVSALELAAYQRAVRSVLVHPLVTETYPDPTVLPLIRRWADQLAAALADVFGYRLELTARTARLIRARDELDPTQPARTATDRPFDRRRYAYLTLTLAALERAGTQIALSELADEVAADARQIDGLGMSTERAAERAAFVDAVAWLETRGALRLADGSARRWADDPDAGEALYDVDRDVVAAVYRPTKVLQHVRGVSSLLAGVERRAAAGSGVGRDVRRRDAAQRAARALVERPVVYLDGVDTDVRNVLRGAHTVGVVEELTGLVAERRADGVALIDTSGGFSDLRFPGTGTVAQTALLLIGEIAARLEDEDPTRLTRPARSTAGLAAAVDEGLPRTGVLTDLAEAAEPIVTEAEGARYPLIEQSWLDATMTGLLDRYGSTFASRWRLEPDRLLTAAIDLLADLDLVVRVPGGVLACPLMGRYRQVAVQVRRREAEPSLFEGL